MKEKIKKYFILHQKTIKIWLKGIGKVFLALFIAGSFIFTGWIFGYSYGQQVGWLNENLGFSQIDTHKFLKVFYLIKKNHPRGFLLEDSQKLTQGLIKGLVETLGDEYSDYLPPEKVKIFNEDIRGTFEGVGIEIGIRKGILTVIAPLEGTPAWRAGLKSGDQILKINGEPTLDITLEEAVKKIRGPRGTKVVLTIYRKEWGKAKDIEIIRDRITIPTIKYRFISPDIGYIKIITFNPQTLVNFLSALENLTKQGARKFILDVRNNPGGFLEVALQMAGWFVRPGAVLVQEQFAKGPPKLERNTGIGLFRNTPVVILVNQGSASASEIFALALKENRDDIKIIGEKTFGKGTVQRLFNLDRGQEGVLKLTVAEWLSPKGNRIEKEGIKPDIEIKEKRDFLTGEDKILSTAIEVIRKMENAQN